MSKKPILTNTDQLGDVLKKNDVEMASKVLQQAIVHFYRHLMMLENYALLNYTGFEKVCSSALSLSLSLCVCVYFFLSCTLLILNPTSVFYNTYLPDPEEARQDYKHVQCRISGDDTRKLVLFSC